MNEVWTTPGGGEEPIVLEEHRDLARKILAVLPPKYQSQAQRTFTTKLAIRGQLPNKAESFFNFAFSDELTLVTVLALEGHDALLRAVLENGGNLANWYYQHAPVLGNPNGGWLTHRRYSAPESSFHQVARLAGRNPRATDALRLMLNLAPYGRHWHGVMGEYPLHRALYFTLLQSLSGPSEAEAKNIRQFVATLIEFDIDVNDADMNGDTPLLIAAWGGYIDVAHDLIVAGADYRRRETRLKMACENHPGLAEQLNRAIAKRELNLARTFRQQELTLSLLGLRGRKKFEASQAPAPSTVDVKTPVSGVKTTGGPKIALSDAVLETLVQCGKDVALLPVTLAVSFLKYLLVSPDASASTPKLPPKADGPKTELGDVLRIPELRVHLLGCVARNEGYEQYNPDNGELSRKQALKQFI